jgi:hypothetical protein
MSFTFGEISRIAFVVKDVDAAMHGWSGRFGMHGTGMAAIRSQRPTNERSDDLSH